MRRDADRPKGVSRVRQQFASFDFLRWPKSVTAISICSRQFQFYSRQFQFVHGNFNLLTAISICSRQFHFHSRQFQFHSRQFQFYSRQFQFILGNFNFSSNKPQVHCTLFQEPITRSKQLPCVVVTHFPSVSIAFFSLSVDNRFLLFELSFPFPLIS